MTKKILLVEDDSLFCQLLGRAFERLAYQVLLAENIAQALQHIENHQPQYAVVDLRIGEESGLQLLKEIQNISIKIIILTGYASIATAVEAIKLGAIHYLTKPVTAEDIIQAFDKVEGDSEVAVESEPMSVKRLEWEHLQKVLQEHDNNISAAARALKMHRRTLQRKLQKKPVKQ